MSTTSTELRISRRRRVAYGILGALLPFLLLIAAELTARTMGAGAEDQDAFVPTPGRPDYRGLNPTYPGRYFRGFNPSVAPDVFLAQKPDSSLRVFVLGGSSTAGYPYMFYSSFPAQLQRKLDRRFFDLQVEVVNLGMTAVNSYTLWDLRNAVVDEEPDAILIYAGHNEFYGAFGAGSTMYSLGNKVWLKRLLLYLKNSVLFRRIDVAIRGSVDRPDQHLAARTMMSRLAGEQEIAFGDGVYSDGITQLESNLNDVVKTFEGAGIPVFLATIASNLRDQPPFGADSTAADEYNRGLRLVAQGQFAQARDAFVRARDYDTIRFRAPSAINEHIREIAVLRGATLVDCEARIRSQSENGVEGDDWFVDHLHLSAAGYGLIADAFFDALIDHFVYDGPSLRQPETEDLVLDPIEGAAAAINLERLVSGFPFVEGQSARAEAEALSRLVETKLTSGSKSDSIAMLMLMNRLSPAEALRLGLDHTVANDDTASALRLYRSLITLQAFDTGLPAEAASLASSTTRYDDILADIALEGVKRTDDDRFLGLLAATAIRGMRLDDAELLLSRLERRNPDEPTMLFNQARLHVLLGDTAGARQYFLRFRAGQ